MGRGCQLSQAASQAQGEGAPGKLLELQVRSDRRDGVAWSFGGGLRLQATLLLHPQSLPCRCQEYPQGQPFGRFHLLLGKSG